MQAQRLILETNQYGQLIQQPQLPANAKWEAIFLLLEERPQTAKRKPSAKLSQIRLTNELPAFESVITDAEMDAFMTRTAQQIAGINKAFE